jgi:hypothetical protein
MAEVQDRSVVEMGTSYRRLVRGREARNNVLNGVNGMVSNTWKPRV